jgi:hypothetical protein
VLYFGETVVLVPLMVSIATLLFPRQFWPYVVGMSMVFAVLALSQKIVPPRIQAIRDRLTIVSNGTRRIHKELVTFVVGDEASAALGAVFFAHWLGRRTGILLLIAAFAVAVLGGVQVVSDSTARQVGSILVGCCLALCFAVLVLGTSAYGFVNGLVALDSSVTVTPAPVGQTDFATVGWTSQDGLRHSLIYESSEAIATIVNWLDSELDAGAGVRY